MAPFKPRAIGKLLGKYKQAATGATANMAAGRQAFSLATTSSDHTIYLWRQGTNAAHLNHPALVKTSHQPSFCSSNISPFTSADALQSLDISPVPSRN
jgi:hypothetical protein